MLLIALSSAWVLGILIGTKFNVPPSLIFTGLLPVPFVFLFKKHQKILIFFAVGLATLFGAAFYCNASHPAESPTTSYNNQGRVTIEGQIDTPPVMKDNTTHIELSVQKLNDQTAQGKILIFAPRYPEYHYGDILSIQGRLESPPEIEGFDYQAYLAQDGIFSTMLNPKIEVQVHDAGFKPLGWIYSLRDHLSQALSSALPEPQASLAEGIVLGIRSTIPDALQTNLSVTGTAHLLAISGINLSIIAGLMIALGIWLFGRRHYIYVWLALFVIWFYALITGMQAPVIRSAIMASIFLIAELLGRQKNAFPALAFSAAVMVGVTPGILFSISFQLSFLSLIGLIFISPLFQELGRKTVSNAIGEEGLVARTVTAITDSFSVTLAAIIAVWPVIAYNFGIISIIGPLSTLLIAPALSPIIFSGAITAIVGLISTPAAQVFGWVAWLFLSYMLWMVNAFAGLPGAFIHIGNVPLNLVWAYYTVLGIAMGVKSNLKKLAGPFSSFSLRLKIFSDKAMDVFNATPRKYIIIPLLVIACLASFATATLPDNNLHVSILDVGEGDSTLLVSAMSP